MNLQESIRRILRESLESEWNEGNYDYQHGFCHYFAYNIIDKIRERFPNKKVNYYLLLANEVNKDTDEVEQDYLLHVYIKIGDKLLDSNGFTTMDEVEQRVDDWYNRQLTMTPEEYDINVWEEESDEIPKMFFNNQFCNTKRVKEDMEKFLSHSSVKKLLKDTLNESRSSQHLKLMNNLLERFKEEDCICDTRVSFDVEDNYYNVYLVFSQEGLNDKFSDLYGTKSYIQKMMYDVKNDLEAFIPIRNIFIGYYTKPNCEWSPLNESEDNKEKKIQKNLKAIRTLLDTIDVDGLCEMWVEYNPEDGDYEIRSKTTRKYLDMADMVRELKYIDDTIRSWGMKTYVYTPWYVENCEDEVEFLNESEVNSNESFTGVTPTDTTQQLINKPVKLIGDVNTETIIQNVKINPDGSVNIRFQNGMSVNSSLPMLRTFNVGVSIPLQFKIKKKTIVTESESKTYSSLHKLLNMLFDGFDNADYDWANYMCGMGECCDPYAIGFTLPDKDYDDYIFKLVDGEMYDDDGDYPKKLRDELPEVCYESPDLKNPDFDTIVFYGLYAEEIEDYMGPESNWRSDLLKLINKKFGCDAKQIIII